MGQCETLQIIQNLQNTFAHLAQRLLGPFYLHVLFYSAKTPTGNETTSGLSSSRSMRNFSRIGRWLEQALKAFGSSAFDTRQCDFWNKIKSINIFCCLLQDDDELMKANNKMTDTWDYCPPIFAVKITGCVSSQVCRSQCACWDS